MEELKYEIRQFLTTIGEGTKGWKKEVNIISWNDRRPKLDIRDWDETHQKMGKGITLNRDEADALKRYLQVTDLEALEL